MPWSLPNITVPLPCVFPKPEPVIVIWFPAVALVGETLMMVGVHRVTVKVAEPVIPPEMAESVVVPEATALASPSELIVPTCGAAELQLTVCVTSLVLPSEKVPVAVNCRDVPVVTEELVGATAMETRLGATVYETPLLATEFPVTTTVAAPTFTPVGTTARIVPVLQLVIAAGIPLNVTAPCP
jgi:hypothetical protein